MRDALLTRAQEAVELAKSVGADEVFATATRSREVEFTVRDGTLEKVKDATSRGLSVRLFVDGRYASSSTTDLRPAQLEAFLREAVALTAALQPDPHRTITDPSLYEGRSDVALDLVDGGLATLTREDRLALCEAQNTVFSGVEGVISASSGTSDGHSVSAAASSNGFSGTKEETWLWIGSEVTLQDEGDRRPEAWMWGGAAHREQVPGAEDVAKLTLERAKALLGATKGPTAKTTMVLDPSISASLIGRLLGPANASSVQQGQSFWADKIGEKAVSELLSITDDPLLPRGLASRLYDGEGIAARTLPIIEKGVLRHLYVDTYYGKKLGMDPTTGASSNRVVTPGEHDLAALIAQADGGIYVTSWLGGNADRTTGDFSYGLRGHLIEKGSIGAPISEMNVTGNLLDLFAHLVAVGSDPWPYGSTLAPTLVFEDVQFSGA